MAQTMEWAFVILKLTTRCNLSCVYCSEPHRDTGCTVDDRVLGRFIEVIQSLRPRRLDILMTGGEVLSIPESRLADIFVRLSALKGTLNHVRLNLQTNGTLITPSICDLLRRHEVKIGVSIDLPRDVHDTARVTSRGGTWKDVTAGIRMLKRENLNFGILTVMSAQNAGRLQSVYSGMKRLGCGNAKFIVYSPSGVGKQVGERYSVGLSLGKVMTKLFDLWASDDSDFRLHPYVSVVRGLLTGSCGLCEYSANTCSHIFAIAADGTILPCARAEAIPGLQFGSILDGHARAHIMRAMLCKQERSAYLRRRNCKGCEFFAICSGGCFIEAVIQNGEAYSRTPQCAANRQLFSHVKNALQGTPA